MWLTYSFSKPRGSNFLTFALLWNQNCHQIHVTMLFLSLSAEKPHYEPAGEEIVVPDMHTRKKMMFDKVKLSWWLMYVHGKSKHNCTWSNKSCMGGGLGREYREWRMLLVWSSLINLLLNIVFSVILWWYSQSIGQVALGTWWPCVQLLLWKHCQKFE